MSSTRKIIHAFLASPGDLQEERKAIRNVVDEFNELWADNLGYQIELLGWEETVAGYGRPQHLINQDLDRCDLFIGMIWKRWGTPPDLDGKFTSGFEEEFERSIARRETKGSPEIALFFKEISAEFMQDPGADLKKVIEFKEKIITGKKILFQTFSAQYELEKLARKRIAAFVNGVKVDDELSEPSDLKSKRALVNTDKVSVEGKMRELSPLSADGYRFLESFVDIIRQPEAMGRIAASDIARFRLLANSISKPGNDEMSLGVHDINILFTEHVSGIELGDKEKRWLVRLGFQHLDKENVPIWFWYSALKGSKHDIAVASSYAATNDDEKAGAISVLTALAIDLPANGGIIKRDVLISSWFADSSTTKVRIVALRYLSKFGTLEEFELARKEYSRSEYGTSPGALECMIGILLRSGQIEKAQKLVFESQFDLINSDLLRTVLESAESLDSSILFLGLEHRNYQVRLTSIKSLSSRGELDMGMADRLSEDSDARVRNEAIVVLKKLGRTLTDEELKIILTQPQKQAKSGLLGLSNFSASGQTGEELFEQHQLEILKNLSEIELKEKVGNSLIYSDDSYFVLAERFFKNRADILRQDVDDRFSSYFEERIRRLEALIGNRIDLRHIVTQTRDLENYWRKALTRKGLNILCSMQKLEDLQRIKANLSEGFASVSKLDATYLRVHGEWIDLPVLINAASLATSISDELSDEIARAIISIGKSSPVSDLLSLEMPSVILRKSIDLCSEARFSKISRGALLMLLNHESDDVRKCAAIMTVRSLSKENIKSILMEYVSSEKFRYYNVIHWLDLGVSMNRTDAREVVKELGSWR